MSLTTLPGSKWPIPYVDDDDCEVIGNLDVHDYGGGVVLFRGVLDVDQGPLFEYIDKYVQHSTPGIYLKEENGEQWSEDRAGERFPVERYYSNPYRLGGYGDNKPVMDCTPPDIRDFFYENEHMMYLCLMKYVDVYTHLLNSLWWHFRGNVLKYFPNGQLGMHSDNDTSYKTIDGQRYETGRPEAIYQTLSILVYYNDCVDSEEELDGTNFMGGEMWFPYLNNLTYQPRTGDMLFFPANYMGTHGVREVTAGNRYIYQSCYGQGIHTETEPHLIPGYETEHLPWGMAGYLPWVHQDWKRFSETEHSRWTSNGVSWPEYSPNGEINPLNRPVESAPQGQRLPHPTSLEI